jgi:hypothetical protein
MRALAVVITLALAGVAAAQPPGATNPVPGPGGPPNAQAVAQRIENIKKRIRAKRAQAIVDAISPDQQTAGKLFTALAKYDDEFDRLLRDRGALIRQLNNVGAMKDPRALDKLIDDVIANQRAFWDTEERRLAEIRKILTPQQTARLLVVLPEWERRLQNQLRAAIQGGQKNKRPPPSDDPDDP